jgi:N-acetylglucosaminyldiphosphoundecaprenol N-acetyl-beta-D-mannosaminyltransferase
MQKEMKVLGVRFDNVTMDEALDEIFKNLNKQKKGYICTPNPEIVLESNKNSRYQDILNNSILNIPDGIGILWAATHISRKSSKLRALLSLPLIAISPGKFKKVLRQRVTGIDLVQEIAQRAAKSGEKIFLLGAASGIAEIAAEKLKAKFENLKIVGTFAGSPHEKDRKEILDLINKSSADILFVAYGAPAQEVWITGNLNKLETVKIAAGIGGSFDFIAGKQKRAPKWMQKLGLEWFYRLIKQPSRWKRIYNATIKFPYEVIKEL